MSNFSYPKKWLELRQSPSARFELLSFVSDVADWNSSDSRIKREGADDLLGFIFDDYRLHDSVQNAVGEIIFPEECEPLANFMRELSSFVDGWQRKDENLSRLHEACAPESLVRSAALLSDELGKPGLPKGP